MLSISKFSAFNICVSKEVEAKMNPIERSAHPSRAQIETLLAFLEENPSLAKGFSKVPSARDATRKKWEKLTMTLNSIGGSVKSWKQWTKYWTDKKSAVKKKAALRSAARRKTGGGIEEVVDFSELEERILTLMGGDGFAEGDRHIAVNLFPGEQSTPQNVQFPLTQDTQIVDIPYSEANPVCVAGTSYLSDNPSLVIPASVARVTADVDTLPPSPSQPQDLQHAAPQEFNSPVRRTQSPRRTTPRRRRRLIRTPASPPSQRRSQLTSLTDRFLRVEEQRLEIESRSVAVSENMARLMREFLQRDQDRSHEVSQGLLAVGEGLKLLAEVLKK